MTKYIECVYSREYLRRNCEWKSVEIMSHTDLTVYSGSTHQADRRLSDVSQCAFTAMLLNVQTPAMFRNGRPTQSMSEILIGDSMCVKVFDDDTIPDTETLSLTYLPGRVHWPMMIADPAKPNQHLPTASEK